MPSTLQGTLVCVWESLCLSQPSPSTGSVALASSPLPMAVRYKDVFISVPAATFVRLLMCRNTSFVFGISLDRDFW